MRLKERVKLFVWGSGHNINLGSTLHLSMSEASSASGRGFEDLGFGSPYQIEGVRCFVCEALIQKEFH
ncbi:hypothetical protein BUE64_13480 [Corynebacterium diphtheriae subsp. lausannense]|nr:hypothetical protein BUE64_13480 [Corynebacterium diphtheriae subsp. lausannense]